MEEYGSPAVESGEAGTELDNSVPGQCQQGGGPRGASGRFVCYGKKTRNDSGGVIAMKLCSGEDLFSTPVKSTMSLKDWVSQVREMDLLSVGGPTELW